MENIDNTGNPINDIQSDETKKDIGTVFKFILYNLIIYLLKLPYALFKKSITRLVELSKKGSLDISESVSKWPLLSWMKTYLIEFMFDAITFLVYILGYPFIIFGTIYGLIEGVSFEYAVGGLVSSAIGIYFAPLGIAIVRDVMQLLILPFRKYIDWANKPAQHMDINHSGGIKNHN